MHIISYAHLLLCMLSFFDSFQHRSSWTVVFITSLFYQDIVYVGLKLIYLEVACVRSACYESFKADLFDQSYRAIQSCTFIGQSSIDNFRLQYRIADYHFALVALTVYRTMYVTIIAHRLKACQTLQQKLKWLYHY